MQLKEIDKTRYRKHLNKIIWGSILAFGGGALLLSTGLIGLFADGQGSNFKFNLAGVVLAGLAVTTTLLRYKQHPFMREVAYVWDLKQELLQINRRMIKLKAAAEQGDRDAMTALNFCYQGSKQLWQLDDNLITMSELAKWITQLESQMARYQVTVRLEDYHRELLKKF